MAYNKLGLKIKIPSSENDECKLIHIYTPKVLQVGEFITFANNEKLFKHEWNKQNKSSLLWNGIRPTPGKYYIVGELKTTPHDENEKIDIRFEIESMVRI